ncbi:putative bifunctional diguanylate cyclase/phosphodiesterase [Krasilnikovia cinnamomea]|uniref:putative bifunctional diguanylate cyclase/phosphodiesterase n=1 Tax=Krasilnikovia cinnamomea TaxID=349313 RepID=UPI00102C95BE|nr:bifunctional diguanylate cyclase/phosphodiesterase [Krasilnikovia cinnamomea]
MTREKADDSGAVANRWYLAVGGLVVLVGTALDLEVRLWVYVAVAASVMGAIAVGVRWHRPAWSAPWWLMVAAVASSLVANAGWALALTPAGVPRFPSFGDLFYALMLVLLVLSNYRWVRPGQRRGGAVEGAIVALGGGAVSWTVVIEPLLFDGRFSGLRLASYLCYAAIDLVFLVLTVRIVVVSRVRTPAYRLMVAASSLLITTNTVNFAGLLSGTDLDRLVALGWLGSYLFIGGAALHPSMARSTGTVTRNPVPTSRGRLLLYVTLILAIGALTVTSLATDRGGNSPRTIGLVLLGGAMSIMLIVRMAQLAALLNRRSRFDGLTALGNRARLQDGLDTAGHRDQVLLLVDLDGFRDLNDSFGDQIGDAVLVETARRLRAVLPDRATVVRISGDEFAVLTDTADGLDGADAAQRILDGLHHPYRLPGIPARRIAASIGVVPLGANAPRRHALRDADLALRSARLAGGQQYAVYDAAVHAERLANTQLVADLHRALEDGEFTVHYQPIVALATGAVVEAEALLRWTRPDGTSISPGRFIPLAEQSGAIVAIGSWVLSQVCADLRDLHRDHGLSVTVNVSAQQLRDPRFAQHVLDLLERNDLPGSALIVEITETVLVTSVVDAGTVTEQLQILRDHHVRIAIDDFGTGYSSLAYLRQLPVDILKMDGSFTALQIEEGTERDLAFIRAILELSRNLGLQTIAEAVETAAQADRLRELGCDLAQGYHFARPAPLDTLHKIMRERRDPAAAAPLTHVELPRPDPTLTAANNVS